MHDIKNIIKNLNVSELPPETRRELKKYLVQIKINQEEENLIITVVKIIVKITMQKNHTIKTDTSAVTGINLIIKEIIIM